MGQYARWNTLNNYYSSVEPDFLESKDLVVELADRASLFVAETLACLLQAADHRWGTAKQQLDVRGSIGQPFLNIVSILFCKCTAPVHLPRAFQQ